MSRRLRGGRDVEWYIIKLYPRGGYDLWCPASSERQANKLLRDDYPYPEFSIAKITTVRVDPDRRDRSFGPGPNKTKKSKK